MHQYLELIRTIMNTGVDRPDRTGVGTRSIFGHVMRFDMADGFPLTTTKYVPFKLPLAEVLWMLEGSSNTRDLHKHGAYFWDKWAKEDGELGRVYGVQWRHWHKYWQEDLPDGRMAVVRGHYDQIEEAVRLLKEDPYSRRILVTAWNPGELDQMALPPCPYVHQLYVADGRLSMIMNWRSVDVGIGMPFDIAGYAILLHMYAHVAGLKPHELICVSADTHIYANHFDAVRDQFFRQPYELPTLTIKGQHDSMLDFTMDDFELSGYNYHPHIKMEANV